MIQPSLSLIAAALFASVAFAQDLFISQPAANSIVTAGRSLTVKLDRPMSLTGSQDIAVAIGIVSCTSATQCPDVARRLGEILYSGLYSPQLYDRTGNPYQNFTVTIPPGYSGPVQLGVAHFYLLAAGPSGQLQFTQTNLNAVESGYT